MTSAPDGRRRLAVGVILLAGLAIRLVRLGAESLWYDETVSVYLAGSPLPELLRHTAGDIHPPGYYALLRAWLLLTGYGDGRADPVNFGLEFVSGFLSLFFGVLLIALVYSLARRLAGETPALVAAAFVAFSPFNIWYSQEVRMYTLGAALGVIVLGALLRLVEADASLHARRPSRLLPAFTYALAAAAGLYTLYYFAFLLVALNIWALASLLRRRRPVGALLLANLVALALYAPWIPVAFRQATQPPVPPWRAAPDLPTAIVESWTALSFGQSAPVYVWPALLLTLALYVLGLRFVVTCGRGARENRAARAVGLATATFGPLLLILLVSFVTPLYHVRYLFTYSPAFYVVLAAGVVALARGLRADRHPGIRARSRPVLLGVAIVVGLVWLSASALSLRAYWFDPAYRADDHRGAVRELEARWRPGDVALVNAGWAYTAFATYWTGELAGRSRITEPLPAPRADAGLLMVTTGHVDGDSSLGWGDPRSDFFAVPSEVAEQQISALLARFGRVWNYRIYDTVNDPTGQLRAVLQRSGQPTDSRTYPGEAYLSVEGYAPREGAAWNEALPGARYEGGLEARFEPVAITVEPGEAVYVPLTWRPATASSPRIGTSLRLIDPAGDILFQPPDEQPLGPAFPSTDWPAGIAQRQTLRIAAPAGTPPGNYPISLVVYAADGAEPYAPNPVNGAQADESGLLLGTLTVTRPAQQQEAVSAVAEFGPVALLESSTPATVVDAGGVIPLELLWQTRAPLEDLVVVAQLLDESGAVVANLEEQPLGGRYPTSRWTIGERVRDRHSLAVPAGTRAGDYRLIVGAYRASDGARLTTRSGIMGQSDHYTIGEVTVRQEG